jgi:hypothetical protein
MTRVMSLIDWLMLSRVVFCVPFLIDFFIHPLIFGWLELELHDFYNLFFMGLSWSHGPVLISWFGSTWLVFLVEYIYIYDNPKCPGQLTRTTTNPRTHWTPYKPSKQVRHCGGDRRAQRRSNLGAEARNSLPGPLSHDLKC